jgi:peptidyl-prolyl cis-trans isomerase D
MLSFFRRIIHSRVGVVVTLGILGVIALAFAAGDITNVRGDGATLSGGEVAEVDGAGITEAELRQRTQTAMQSIRQRDPSITMEGFIAQGGLKLVLDRAIDALALRKYADRIGVVVGKKTIDGEIASIPAFQGPDGRFSQQTYENVLGQQRITEAQLREDMTRDIVTRYLVSPTAGASQVPAQLAQPYASLLLERRQGLVGYIPVSAVPAGAAPTEQEIANYYARNRGRYTVPERRSARYALVRAEQVAQAAKPTEQEIAQAYRQQAARFAASEKRTVTQVVIADEAAATVIATRVKGGQSMADAARGAGLEPATFTSVDKATLARQTSVAVADAAFANAKGTVVGPVRSPLGWHVVRVDAVEATPAKTLAEVRGELSTELAKQKAADALTQVHDGIDDAIGEGATFDEIVADHKLTPATTPALLASGVNPDAPATQPDAATARIAGTVFTAEPGDAPQIVQTAPDGSFALVAVGNVVPAAPRPIAQVREQLVKDLVAERSLAAARTIANAAVGKVGRGVPIDRALSETGLRLPPPQRINLTRGELAGQGRQLPPSVALMFSMASKRAKLLEAPNRTGWYVVYLDSIQNGDASGNPALIAQTRAGLGSVVGQEYVAQFAAAVRAKLGVKRDEGAIAKVQRELSGAGGADN